METSPLLRARFSRAERWAKRCPAIAGDVRGVSEGVGNAVRRFAVTGPKVTAKLVEDMKAANAAGDAYSNVQAKIETARENALKEGNINIAR